MLFIGAGVVVCGILMIHNPMLFWPIEKQRPLGAQEPDAGWQREIRVKGICFIAIGVVGLMIEGKITFNL